MQRIVLLATTALLALGCAGCTTTPEKEADARELPVYRPGSNIAVKDHGVPSPVLSVRPDDVQTTKMPKWPATAAAGARLGVAARDPP